MPIYFVQSLLRLLWTWVAIFPGVLRKQRQYVTCNIIIQNIYNSFLLFFVEYPLHTENEFDDDVFFVGGPRDPFGVLFMGTYPNATFTGILCEKGMSSFACF